jgi:hypothetical protein
VADALELARLVGEIRKHGSSLRPSGRVKQMVPHA